VADEIDFQENNAVSTEGDIIKNNLKSYVAEFYEPLSASEIRVHAKEELDNKIMDFIKEGYDNEIYKTLIASYERALTFINKLPISIQVPEISIENDGEIAFDWINGKYNYFSVSIGPSSFIHYAAINKLNKFHGKELLLDEFPEKIHTLVSDIFN
ncbi:MAG: hypothetical protein ABIA63_08610, partial [bacterium]